MLAARDELADDRGARKLPGDDQAAGGLGIGEQERFDLVNVGEAGVGAYPVEVAAGTAADVAVGGRFAGPVEVADRGGVDDGRHAAGPRKLEYVPEQAEPGDVGG